MRTLFSLLLTFVFITSGYSQTIEFEKTNYNFGKIKEIDGPVEVEFNFKNTSTEPVLISNVKPSCGCTSVDWSKEVLKPGATGFVKASYNPRNRPGVFKKTVTVFTNGEPSSYLLSFSGFVLARERTLQEAFPLKTGALRFSSNIVDFGRISVQDTVVKMVKIYNDASFPISFTQKKEFPASIQAEFPVEIGAGKTAEIKFTYFSAKEKAFGPVSDLVIFYTNESSGAKKSLQVEAEIVDYIPTPPSAEQRKYQKMELDRTSVKFDSVIYGTSPVQEIEISNSGKKDLLIRAVSSPVPYIAATTNKTVIKPGEKALLKIMYNSKGRYGRDAKLVKIYSNDPENLVREIDVRANVVK